MNSCVKQQDKQIISQKPDYYDNKIPEDWKIYETTYEKFKFSYPTSLGEINPGSGSGYQDFGYQEFNPNLDKKLSFIPNIRLTGGPIISDLLGPLHGFHPFFADGHYLNYLDKYDKTEAKQVRDSVINHLSKLNVDNFCDELKTYPLNHTQHLDLPNDIKTRVAVVEKKNGDFKALFGFGRELLSCNLDTKNNIIEFTVINKMPERWVPNAKIVEAKDIGAIKFLPKNSNKYSAFIISVPYQFGNESISMSESEIQKTIYLMVKSFKILE